MPILVFEGLFRTAFLPQVKKGSHLLLLGGFALSTYGLSGWSKGGRESWRVK
jgi:hypothetical protein